MWGRQNGLHSSQFLAGPIHQAVESRYYKLDLLNQAKDVAIYKRNAEKLQAYLYDLKNYQNIKHNERLFSETEYNLFINAFQEVTNSDGLPLANSFLGMKVGNARRGQLFENELIKIKNALELAIQKECQNQKGFSFYKQCSISIDTGSGKTHINFPEFYGELNNKILHDICGVGTLKTLKQNGITTKYYSVDDVQPKIDVVNQSGLQISANIHMQFPALADFASLYLNSTITAKNYAEKTIEKHGVGVGKGTQIFRIMADFVPTLNLISTRQQEISFQYALFKRYGGLVKQRIGADKEIEEHFSHIQNIYQLMGVGQHIIDPDMKDLQDYLKKGAEYLIVNVHNSSNIYVRSTRDILREMYDRMGMSNFSAVGKATHIGKEFLT